MRTESTSSHHLLKVPPLFHYLTVICIFTFNTEVTSVCKKCFEADFIWGTATSSYQVEGAWNLSGKGENIWDMYTHNYPELIRDGSNGDVATDSYHKTDQDVELLRNLGVKIYRFSISWARVLPDGTLNNINKEGVDYYLDLIQKLKNNNIEPMITLYHWDLPLALHEQGGWTDSSIIEYFADYAAFCYERFGPYVKYWITMNESLMICYYGYGTGTHAPGLKESGTLTYDCFYYQLMAHARAYRIYNDTFKATQNGEVGTVLVSHYPEPLTDSEEDKHACENYLQWNIGLVANPMVHGNWPQIVINRVGNLSALQGYNKSRLPELTDEDIKYIKGTYDYFGLNYYTTFYITSMPNISELELTTASFDVDKNAVTSSNASWPVAESVWLHNVPKGLRRLLKWLSETYNGPRIIITENGWSDGGETLNDTSRITYIQGHVCNVLMSKYLDGVNIFGYLYWSFMNNFEWNAGYMEKFGLIDVDFESDNKTRTPKESYYYYKNLAESGCLEYCAFKDTPEIA
ncbi:myrosinase 1-like [Euwallacea similis]|uniref:myrosinase 1-like n=1 Tax=Euwallacea similis TaxID=1736056 RepID=UPI0034505507